MIKCFFDGACGPYNPGGAIGFGIVVLRDGREILRDSGGYDMSMKNSNNVAEYLALKWLLETLLEKGLEKQTILVQGDSALVINQMNGLWFVKKGLYTELAQDCKELVGKFSDITFLWIERSENYVADELSKRALAKFGYTI